MRSYPKQVIENEKLIYPSNKTSSIKPFILDKLFSYIIVTPNLHRLHHSQSFKDTQYNYASILTIWDKLFHTCSYPKYPEKIQLGLTEYNNHLNIINLIFLPLTKH